MNEFKLVPVEPTREMLDAPLQGGRFENRVDLRPSIYRAMLAAAPAVQGEPVATIHVDGSFVHVAWRIPAPSRCAMDVYTAPQPAPDVRCEGCGYMTRHREHMGCVRAAKQNQADVSDQASPTPFESAINRVREASDRIQNAVDEWERHIAASGMPSPLTRIVPEGFLAHLRSVILGIDSAYRGSPSPENQYLLGQCVDALTGLIPDIDAALAAHRKGAQP